MSALIGIKDRSDPFQYDESFLKTSHESSLSISKKYEIGIV